MKSYNAKSTNWRLRTDQSRRQTKPISKSFEVLDATGGHPKPFYIYKFSIWKARENSIESKLEDSAANPPSIDDGSRISKRVRELVFTKAINSWIDENQPENSFYLVGPAHDRLLTQFALPRSEFTNDQDEESCERAIVFNQQVVIKNPQLVDSEFKAVDEIFTISYTTLISPIINLNRTARHREVCHIFNLIILADIEGDEKFASTRNNQVYKLDFAKENPRAINQSPYLSMILGLSIKIKQFRSRKVEGEISTLLRIYESSDLFFEPVNMVKLLQEYFEFNINAPLDRDQIARIKSELQWQTIEMRVESSAVGDGDEEHDDPDPDQPEAENYVTCIKDVSLNTVAEEICEFSDQLREFTPTGEITVERQLRREFPDVELKYTHLPCLISPQGRKMPIEVCWIKPGRPLERCPTPYEMSKLHKVTHSERLEIFEENCRELIRDYGSTLEKFGFKLSAI